MAIKKGPAIRPVLLRGKMPAERIDWRGGTKLAHVDGHRVTGLPINSKHHLDITLAT